MSFPFFFKKLMVLRTSSTLAILPSREGKDFLRDYEIKFWISSFMLRMISPLEGISFTFSFLVPSCTWSELYIPLYPWVKDLVIFFSWASLMDPSPSSSLIHASTKSRNTCYSLFAFSLVMGTLGTMISFSSDRNPSNLYKSPMLLPWLTSSPLDWALPWVRSSWPLSSSCIFS